MPFHEPDDTRDYVPLVVLNTNAEENNDEVQNVQPKYTQRSLLKRVGITGFLTIFLGSAVLLLPIVLLALFWRESMIAIAGDKPETYWIRIVNASWTTRLVTVCTTAIRTVVALQAGLATAMVAGIAMETTGIPLLQGPIYSIIRAVKVAPSSLLMATDFRPHLSFFIGALVTIEILVTTSSQFLSTIFLSDFADGSFTLPNNSTNISILANPSTATTGWWTMPPAASWTFAELSDSFTEGPDYHDTGHTYRAFLPFENEAQRIKLRSLRGPVPVMDHRVVCASPALTNMTLDASDQGKVRLSGQIAMKNKTYPMLLNAESQPYINFTCQLPAPLYRANNMLAESSICFANSGSDWVVLLEDPLVPPTANEGSPSLVGYPEASTMFMVLDMVSAEAMLDAVGAEHAVQMTRTNGPWSMVTNGSDVEALRISACVTNLGAETLTVGMNSSADNLEPSMSWDIHGWKYLTESSRRQLGASRTRESLKSRGVLALEPKSQWQNFQRETDMSGYGTPWFFSLSLIYSMPTAIYLTTNTTLNPGVILSGNANAYSVAAHLTHVDMFQDTLNATSSPALALQVLLTRVCQMAYYEQLVKMGTKAAASTAFSVVSSIPVQWTGFIIGMALIATHFVVVGIVAVHFLSSTAGSVIGSYWQAVSQVVSKESLPILEQADRMSDAEVESWAQHQSLDLKSRRKLQYQDDGRVAVGTTEDEG
ncbi:uncharacterized protein N7479_010527 [Penicillium vulpinum]|uniref:Uncharacterized protein n=1 Tax=Penicillium vulpinum TaxID=29845 RepID=A0A1V6S8T2_9EURO|nr:uncharacterized protein N7479_010527 [Penicillium vulpinum]KAJ5952114.1 hypothetical protein N7479_010527 [Penicillium vulpinum]OQE10149.1 hypothetical protein PENVUL_c004G09301 [Penicillium vulpinum]